MRNGEKDRCGSRHPKASKSTIWLIAVACLGIILSTVGTSEAQDKIPTVPCGEDPAGPIEIRPVFGPMAGDSCDTNPWGLTDEAIRPNPGETLMLKNNTTQLVVFTAQAGLFTQNAGELEIQGSSTVCVEVLPDAQYDYAYWFNSDCQDRPEVDSRPRIIIVSQAGASATPID